MKTTPFGKDERGMTLVEVIAVIVLIGLITTVVARGIFGKGDEAKAKLNVVKMENLKQILGQYRLEYNSYPPRLDNLMTASGDVQKSGKLFTKMAEENDLVDVFGFPFVYKTENNGRSYSLSSFGADGVQGGEGANQDVTVRP